MRTILIVAELVQHCIKYLFIWVEIPFVVWPPQSELNFCSSSYIEPLKSWVGRTAFPISEVNEKHTTKDNKVREDKSTQTNLNSERIRTFHLCFRIIGCTCFATVSRIFLASSSPIFLSGLISHTLLRSLRSMKTLDSNKNSYLVSEIH